MASRVHTINSAAKARTEVQSPSLGGQVSGQCGLLSNRLDLAALDQRFSQPVRVLPNTGSRYFPTAEAIETQQLPTYSGPSVTTRMILGGVSAAAQAASQAAATAAVHLCVSEQQRTSHATAGQSTGQTQSKYDTLAAKDLDQLPEGQANDDASPPNQQPVETPGSAAQGQSDIGTSPNSMDDAAAVTASSNNTQDAEVNQSVQASSDTASQQSPVATQCSAQTNHRSQYNGDIQVRFNADGFDLGSGLIARTRRINTNEFTTVDHGVQLFANGRSTDYMDVGSAVRLLLVYCWHS